MSSVSTLAIVPARKGSKGIPNKNLRTLGGKTLIERAVDCAREAGILEVAVSTDYAKYPSGMSRGYSFQHDGTRWVEVEKPDWHVMTLPRPAELAQDDTPMLAVVQHALEQIPGPPDQIIVLLQPTQPFRTPAHVRAAIDLLRETQADSVVSVVELPKTHSPEFVCHIMDGKLYAIQHGEDGWSCYGVAHMPTRRQDAMPAWIRDGTVYAFFRKTLDKGSIYGYRVRPLIIPARESCELDTEQDWINVERRFNELSRVGQ